MHRFSCALIGFAIALLTPGVGVAKDKSKDKGQLAASVDASCKYVNKKKDEVKFEGDCEIKQKLSPGHNEVAIKLDGGQNFHFADDGSGYKVTKKGETHDVDLEEKGKKQIFRWGQWKLVASPK
jgi:hypothetical protein